MKRRTWIPIVVVGAAFLIWQAAVAIEDSHWHHRADSAVSKIHAGMSREAAEAVLTSDGFRPIWNERRHRIESTIIFRIPGLFGPGAVKLTVNLDEADSVTNADVNMLYSGP